VTKAVGVIPARWGSTRFPGKPLHLIAAKPLLQHVWQRCRRARSLDSVIIATDDMRIAEAAFDWGAEVALTSAHHRSGTDRVAEVIQRTKQFGFVVNIQGDEPLIDPGLIDRLVKKLRSGPAVQMITAAHPFTNVGDALSAHQVKVVVDKNGRALYFSRAPIPYPGSGSLQSAGQRKRRSTDRGIRFLRHQGIYGFRRDLLLEFVRWKRTPLERTESLEQLRALENGVTVHVLVTSHGSPGVDTPEDAISVAASLREEQRKHPRYRPRRVRHSATTTGRRRR
jgi:3-deoxy-manno-octulosonate cytidylyltransferase (CMP-KDO synthetase)